MADEGIHDEERRYPVDFVALQSDHLLLSFVVDFVDGLRLLVDVLDAAFEVETLAGFQVLEQFLCLLVV